MCLWYLVLNMSYVKHFDVHCCKVLQPTDNMPWTPSTWKKTPFIYFPFQLFSLNSPTEHIASDEILVSANDVSLDALLLFLRCPPHLIPVWITIPSTYTVHVVNTRLRHLQLTKSVFQQNLLTEYKITIQIRQLCKVNMLLSDEFSMMAWPNVCSVTVFLIQSVLFNVASRRGRQIR